jgi:hypothetical protein
VSLAVCVCVCVCGVLQIVRGGAELTDGGLLNSVFVHTTIPGDQQHPEQGTWRHIKSAALVRAWGGRWPQFFPGIQCSRSWHPEAWLKKETPASSSVTLSREMRDVAAVAARYYILWHSAPVTKEIELLPFFPRNR